MDLGRINSKRKVAAALKCYDIINIKLGDDVIAKGLAKILKEKTEQVIESIGPKNEKVLTSKLATVDEQRDDAYRAVWHIIQAYSNWNILGDHGTAIKNLNNEVCESGLGFLGGSYMAESTFIKNKIDIMNKPEYKDAVKAMGLNKFLDELIKLQAEFDAVVEERRIKREFRPLALSKTIPPLNRAIITLDSYIGANYDKGIYDECFKPFATAMNNNSPSILPDDE